LAASTGAAGSGGGFPIVLIALTLNPSAALGPTLSVAAAPCHTGGGGLAAHQQRNPVERPAASGDGDSSRPRLH